ncbi:flippase-like domain-containing protein [candidate division KSB1 bacterium]|nr:flippase-like domain-containing protein [candidate division KSB1 bacterium]
MNGKLLKIKSAALNHKKSLLFGIKIFIAIIILYLLIHRISIEQILQAFRLAQIKFIVFSFLLLFVNVFLQFKKWKLLVGLVKPDVRNYEILSSLLAGLTLGLITPGRVGEFGRALFIKECKWTSLVGLVMVDKIFALVVIYLFGLFGFFYFMQLKFNLLIWLPLKIILFLVLIVFLFFILHPQKSKMMLIRFFPFLQKKNKINQVISSLDGFHKKDARKLLSLALLHVMVYVFQFYLLIRAFTTIQLYRGLLAIGSTIMAKTLLPISFGDLGIRESAAVFFFGQFNVSQAAAFNASFLLFLINVFIPGLAGLVLLMVNRLYDNNK